MSANFKTDLKRGAAGEERIQAMFPKWTRKDGRKEDFVTEQGELVEVKTESRTTAQTPNVALETESSPGKPGAIQRAVDDGVSLVVYIFADDKVFFYDAVKLLKFMNSPHNYREVKIQNRTYQTTIIVVPRADLKDVQVERETHE